MKKILALLTILLVFSTSCAAPEKSSGKTEIVTTNFVCYDFARAVAGEKAEIKMLIPAGSDMHSFEPTAKDIADIQNCDLFIYIGGESDVWANKTLENKEKDKIIKMIDCATLIETEHGADEHIWTSPDNAIKMVRKTLDALCTIDSKNADFYTSRAEKYINEISSLAEDTKSVIQNAKQKTVVVADRFPFIYFTEYYSLEYTAAFGGCEHDTDPSLHTVTHLIDTVKNKHLSAIYRIEQGGLSVADAVSRATGAEILELHSYQNVSLDDFNKGITYTDIMKKNCEALRKGLK